MISVIIPAFNEESSLPTLLRQLADCKEPHEVLVADGGSTDNTADRARPLARVVACPRNRGLQLNAGAREARGDILLFLHADVRLPPGALLAVERVCRDPQVVGGHFSVTFAGEDRSDRIFTHINRIRYHFGVFYGDSGIFVRRSVFERLGGFKPWPIMEDYEFARHLRRAGRIAWLREPLWVSSRRWQGKRLWRTLTSWFFIQTFYFLGIPPAWLARWYAPVRESGNAHQTSSHEAIRHDRQPSAYSPKISD